MSSEIAESRIRQLILAERLPAGRRLPSERGLADQFGVSRISIRAATAKLTSLGVLEVRPRSGTYVATNEATPVLEPLRRWFVEHNLRLEELVEYRQAVEPAAAFAAAVRRRDTDLDLLAQHLDAMTQAIQTHDHASFSAADRAFHKAVARASGNRLFVLALESIERELDEYLRTTARLGGAMLERSLADHRAVQHAIARAQPMVAHQAMARHTSATVTEFRITSPDDVAAVAFPATDHDTVADTT